MAAFGALVLFTSWGLEFPRPVATPQPLSELCAGASARGRCPGLVELVVRDVIPLEEVQAHAVVLMSLDQRVVVPIFVDEGAAVAIAFRLAHQTPPQPLSQDLLDTMVSTLGAHVTGVRIDDVHAHAMTTHVFLEQGNRHVGLSARPSDAVALALSSGTRIWATPEVVRQAGITKQDIRQLGQEHPMGVGGSGSAGVVPSAPPRTAPREKPLSL